MLTQGPTPADELPGALPSLSVVIVNWNSREDLLGCLGSLREACDGLDAEIVVVDNHSHDGSADHARAAYPPARVFALGENLGFAGGCNEGIRAARGEYVLLLNPDVRLTRSALRELLGHLIENPDVSVVGPALTDATGRVQTPYYRRFPSRMQMALFFTPVAPLAYRVPWIRYRCLEHRVAGSDAVEVSHIPGACCLVRRRTIDEVGLLDPDYFLWFEDADWSLRIRRAGGQLRVLPSVPVVHGGGGSFGLWSDARREWQFGRAFFRFLCKHRLDGVRRWAYACTTANLVLNEVLARVHPRLAPMNARQVRFTPEVLRATRASIKDVVRRHRAGELVRFRSARPPWDQHGEGRASRMPALGVEG